MLRLPQLGVEYPEDLQAAIELLARPGARIVAGGTDILPNLKHRLEAPELLVSLTRVGGLDRIEESFDWVTIGAKVTLAELAEDPTILGRFPSLAKAAGLVASPLIRNMGTLGGNLNLDTRCRYVNQTEFWREALGGGCLKSEGDVCWVVPKGRNCVAAMSSDCVPVLLSLDAEVALVGPVGERWVPISDYFRADGLRHTTREEGELMTEIRIPLPRVPQRSTYTKWSVRKSIDFPLISIAMRFDLEHEGANAPIVRVAVVVGALGAKPRVVRRLEAVIGMTLEDPDTANLIADTTHKQCKPLENIPYDASYRRRLIRVLSRRAVASLVEDA